jgi:hypothetical protein
VGAVVGVAAGPLQAVSTNPRANNALALIVQIERFFVIEQSLLAQS